MISPAIILVSPQMGENIGAAARVMYNFGLSDLRLVSPRDGWPNAQADAMAAGAKKIIKNTRVFKTTKEAIADLQYVAAATARMREIYKKVENPESAIKNIRQNMQSGIVCGILFGPERSGLANDDVVLADALVEIPTNPEYPSLNLAQAVAVISYEWCRAGGVDAHYIKQEDIATKGEVLGLIEHLEGELESTGFFRVPEKKQRIKHHIRNVFQRTGMSEQEVNILRGAIKALAKKD